MATATTNLQLITMTTGERSGTWGLSTNKNIEALEQALTGSYDVTFDSTNAASLADYTTSSTGDPDPTDVGRNAHIILVEDGGDPPTAAITLTLGISNTRNKWYFVSNTTNQDATITTGTGSSVVLRAGVSGFVFANTGDGMYMANELAALLTSFTGSLQLSSGTTAQRDASPEAGYLRFNSTLNQFEGYDGTSWGSIGGGATGGSGDEVFVENGTTVTADYTLSANKNAMSVGPITIDAGVTVTVPSGAIWLIL